MSPLHAVILLFALGTSGCPSNGAPVPCQEACEAAHWTPAIRLERFGTEGLPDSHRFIQPHDLAGLAIFKACAEEQGRGVAPAGGVSCLDKHILECVRSCQSERMD